MDCHCLCLALASLLALTTAQHGIGGAGPDAQFPPGGFPGWAGLPGWGVSPMEPTELPDPTEPMETPEPPEPTETPEPTESPEPTETPEPAEPTEYEYYGVTNFGVTNFGTVQPGVFEGPNGQPFPFGEIPKGFTGQKTVSRGGGFPTAKTAGIIIGVLFLIGGAAAVAVLIVRKKRAGTGGEQSQV